MTILAIALSVALFLGVEKVRTGAKASFTDTISGTDLIVGARSGSVQLLLYSVFRIGNATNNLTWQSYQNMPRVQMWRGLCRSRLVIAHRQFRVWVQRPHSLIITSIASGAHWLWQTVRLYPICSIP